MLKKLSRLFLGLVVCAGSACVTPTHASSAISSNDSGVLMVYIQAASPLGAKDEMITLYNTSSEAANITGWCLANKTNVKFACITPSSPYVAYYLPPYQYVVLSTQSFIDNAYGLPENISFIFSVTNQSSGSIVNSADTITLLDAKSNVVDKHSWSTAFPSGKVAARTYDEELGIYETHSSAWLYVTIDGVPESFIETRSVIPGDIDDGSPQNPTEILYPIITEFLPNPLGADVGNEFIEVFNPNETVAIDMYGYKLRVGTKTYSFTQGTEIAPLQHRAFYNSEIKFTLLNSEGSVALEKDGSVFDDTITYSAPSEGWSYALFNKGWAFTAKPTPGMQNILTLALEPNNLLKSGSTTKGTLKPCAANQYRSSKTNRCRLIQSAASTQRKPCAANQYRSPETNRCRLIASTTASPTPCKEGQERNPETNRCRKIVKMTNADYGVKGVQTEASEAGVGWYWWLAAAGLGVSLISYAAWEWRSEILKLWGSLKTKFARTAK